MGGPRAINWNSINFPFGRDAAAAVENGSVKPRGVPTMLSARDSRLPKITELADMLIMERTSLVRALKPLQAAGWVVAERSDNGRAFDVTLSPSGLEKFAEAKPLWAEAQAAFEGEVGRDRAIRLRDEILELNLGG